MKTTCSAAAILLLASSLASAQTQAPKHRLEVQKLGYYVGTWEGHGETKAGPFGQGGKLSSHQTCRWFRGGYQVICEGEETGPSGKRGFLNILVYDGKTKAYTECSISSFGEAEYDRSGSWLGNKLTFIVNEDAGGKAARFRYAETHVSPSMYTYRAEVAVGAKPFAVLAEGRIVKIK